MKALNIEVKNSIVALQSKVNELITMMKVIMMTVGKTSIVGSALKCKGKEEVLELELDARERNAQKDEEYVGYMESDVVTSCTKDASLVTRQRLSGPKQKGSLRGYVKEFTTIVGDIQEIGEKEKLNAFLEGLS